MAYRRENMEDAMDYLCQDLSAYEDIPDGLGRLICSFTWDIEHVRNGTEIQAQYIQEKTGIQVGVLVEY